MAKEKDFIPAKLILGTIYKEEDALERALFYFSKKYGNLQIESNKFPFDVTSYYEKEMGGPLFRKFFVFKDLISPDKLSEVKVFTNRLEEKLTIEFKADGRPVNLDPAILTPTSLIVATAKNYSHRVPLKNGIYAHIEYLFTKKDVKILEWTYQDFKKAEYKEFFKMVRALYLKELREQGVI